MTDLILSPAFEIKSATLSDAGEFTGYGSVFGNQDRAGDVLQPGAFRDSLEAHRSKKTMPKLLWQHDQTQPIGAWKAIREDDRGLHVQGKLNLKTEKGREVHALLKEDQFGLSIGYHVLDAEHNPDGFNEIKAVDLWEVSVVTFPCNPEAVVTSVKSATKPNNIREFEALLREAGALSRSEAKRVASGGWSSAFARRDDVAGAEEAVLALKKLTESLDQYANQQRGLLHGTDNRKGRD